MKYRYATIADPKEPGRPWHRRPIVRLTVFGPLKSMNVTGLVDSGADVTLMDASIAAVLGIDLSSAITEDTMGIDGRRQQTHRATIDVEVDHLTRISIPVAFIVNLPVPCLLGQEGFFDAYRIKFERDHSTFELVPVGK